MNTGQRILVVFNVVLFAMMSVNDGIGQAIVACAIITILFFGVTWAVLGTVRPLITGEKIHEIDHND